MGILEFPEFFMKLPMEFLEINVNGIVGPVATSSGMIRYIGAKGHRHTNSSPRNILMFVKTEINSC